MKLNKLAVDGELKPDGIWAWIHRAGQPWLSRPALFLDRDGVILEFVPYLSRPEAVRLLPGAADAIAAANVLGVPVAVVTNQSGIGRGYYGWGDLAAVLARMQSLLAQRGAHVDAVFVCPYHRDARPPYDHDDHTGRKPNPGMLRRAAHELGLELRLSWIVGDTADDLLAGRAAGLAGGVHVLTGLGGNERERVQAVGSTTFRVELAADLGEAAPRLLSHLADQASRTTAEMSDDMQRGSDFERRIA